MSTGIELSAAWASASFFVSSGHSRQRIRHGVFGPGDVPDVRRELADVVRESAPQGCSYLRALRGDVLQGLVVGEDVDVATLDERAEVTNGSVNGE